MRAESRQSIAQVHLFFVGYLVAVGVDRLVVFVYASWIGVGPAIFFAASACYAWGTSPSLPVPPLETCEPLDDA